MKHEQAD